MSQGKPEHEGKSVELEVKQTRNQRKVMHGMNTACFFTFQFLLNAEGICFLFVE